MSQVDKTLAKWQIDFLNEGYASDIQKLEQRKNFLIEQRTYW